MKKAIPKKKLNKNLEDIYTDYDLEEYNNLEFESKHDRALSKKIKALHRKQVFQNGKTIKDCINAVKDANGDWYYMKTKLDVVSDAQIRKMMDKFPFIKEMHYENEKEVLGGQLKRNFIEGLRSSKEDVRFQYTKLMQNSRFGIEQGLQATQFGVNLNPNSLTTEQKEKIKSSIMRDRTINPAHKEIVIPASKVRTIKKKK